MKIKFIQLNDQFIRALARLESFIIYISLNSKELGHLEEEILMKIIFINVQSHYYLTVPLLSIILKLISTQIKTINKKL